MVCSVRKISFIIMASLLFALPLPLYAAWPYSTPPISDNSTKQPAATAHANTQVLAARDVAPFAPALVVRSQLLTVDSEWRGAVYVDGGITVAPATTLTITPGTVVRFAKGSGIHVLGRIVIEGSVENPVRLGSVYREPQDSDWSGIILSGTEKRNVFANVIIEGAETAVFARFSSFTAAFVEINHSSIGFKLQSATGDIINSTMAVSVTALSAAKSEIFMEKCSITGGQSGIIVNSSAIEARELSINACRLTAFAAFASQVKLDKLSISAGHSALRLTNCDGAMTDSKITDNVETGVVLTGSNVSLTGNLLTANKIGIQIDDTLPALWSNTITGNSSYNLIYLGDDAFFIGSNSFGGKFAEENDNKIFSKRPGAVQLLPFFSTESSLTTN